MKKDENGMHVTADVLVIGFGKGGKMIAGVMGRRGKRVILVEQSDQMYGGTCINIGCVPTKALVHRADIRRPQDEAKQWYEEAVGSVQTITSAMRQKNFHMFDAVDTVTIVTGTASFLDSNKVEVTAGEDRLTITAETIVIGTGSVPVIPDIPGLRSSAHLVTSTDLLRTTDLPERLAIIGGGYLGLEFAGMYAQFGSEVTVLESYPKFFGREDDDVAEAVIGILRDQGITLISNAHISRIEDGIEDATLHYEVGGQTKTLQADTILIATGRTPATEGLSLERAGVEVNEKGAVVVDEYLRTSRSHIFAVGDVNGGPQFTYISTDDHRIVIEQLLGDGSRSTADRRAVPHTVFITPPFSTVGMTEVEARERGYMVRVASRAVEQIMAMPRARVLGDTRGLIKFIIDADTDLILGAALISIESQETINLVAFAIRYGVTASELGNGIYTHPSTTEAFNEILGVAPLPR
jgi:pyruvate/2-oxoglutarate dehydrogenase complex dihydrolipoamide dehydrogenase (E3) component